MPPFSIALASMVLSITGVGLFFASRYILTYQRPLTRRSWVLLGMYLFFIAFVVLFILYELFPEWKWIEPTLWLMLLIFSMLAIPWSSGFDFYIEKPPKRFNDLIK